jgi:hypothetical protein
MIELVSSMSAPHSGTNLRECEDHSWFKVQAVSQDVFAYPRGYYCPRLKTTGSDNQEGVQNTESKVNMKGFSDL